MSATPWRARGLSVVLILLLLMSGLAGIAPRVVLAAPTETVTNLNDSGPGSLRQAIADVDPGGTIDFQPGLTGTILLASELLVPKSLTIDGPGADVISMSGQSTVRVMHILGNPAGVTVTLRGLTIEHGFVVGPYPAGTGGGIYADANSGKRVTLNLEGMTFDANRATHGAAVAGDAESGGTATLTASGTTFSGNFAVFAGGAVYNDAFNGGTATLTTTDTTFSGNATVTFGGAVYNYTTNGGSATLTATRSTFSGNSSASFGGAVFSDGSFGSATVTTTDSTFSTNSAPIGGAIYNDGSSGSATLTVTGSTFSGNSAGIGGAVYDEGFGGNASLVATNTTFSGNSASTGGAVYNSGTTGSATLSATNVTFSDNSAGAGGTIFNATASATFAASILASTVSPACSGGGFASLDYNMTNDASCNLTQPNDQTVVDAAAVGLAPLADNGGPTQTHALLGSSPAVDAAGPAPCLVATDQRGIVRPQDGDNDGSVLCDIGAFERRPAALSGTTLRAFPAFNRVQAGDPLYVYITTPDDIAGTLALADARVGVVPCSAGGSSPTSTQPASSIGGLQYQANQNRYLFIWKTNRLWYPGCRQLILTFTDSTQLRVNAQFVRRR